MARLLRNNLLWVIVLILLAYMVTSALMPRPQSRIKRLIENARVACEEEDLPALMNVFDPGYRDEMGLTFVAWWALFQRAFEKYDNINIRVLDLRVRVDENGREATATVSALGRGTIADTMGIEGSPAVRPVGQVDDAVFTFRKTPIGWRLHSAANLRQDVW